ncbi:MAG TPA: hypothetical protein VHY75_08275 [Steroidobacteraceae bacterium]|nr:hypothetical protein [Steroidobacteraceae bacterium]
MKLRLPSMGTWAVVLALCASTSYAVPVSHIQVRVVTGVADLAAGSYLELRIYEAGKPVRRLALTHGESWPRDSTRIIPLTLNEVLDPSNVQRFSLYYRAASPLSPPWEVVAADVDLAAGREPQKLLLDATLSGEIARQGEIATLARDARTTTCMTDADCDDRKACNGIEHCAPHAPGADARGCLAGSPMECPVNQICAEGRGCVGAGAAKQLTPSSVRGALSAPP